MPPRLSNFVRVRFLDKEGIVKDLKVVSSRLRQKYPEVTKVLLFGSLVKGNYAPGSDADILIILKQDKRRMIDRIPDFLAAFLGVSIDVDVFPYTHAEIDKMQQEDNLFIRRVLGEGVELG